MRIVKLYFYMEDQVANKLITRVQRTLKTYYPRPPPLKLIPQLQFNTMGPVRWNRLEGAELRDAVKLGISQISCMMVEEMYVWVKAIRAYLNPPFCETLDDTRVSMRKEYLEQMNRLVDNAEEPYLYRGICLDEYDYCGQECMAVYNESSYKSVKYSSPAEKVLAYWFHQLDKCKELQE